MKRPAVLSAKSSRAPASASATSDAKRDEDVPDWEAAYLSGTGAADRTRGAGAGAGAGEARRRNARVRAAEADPSSELDAAAAGGTRGGGGARGVLLRGSASRQQQQQQQDRALADMERENEETMSEMSGMTELLKGVALDINRKLKQEGKVGAAVFDSLCAHLVRVRSRFCKLPTMRLSGTDRRCLRTLRSSASCWTRRAAALGACGAWWALHG